MLIGKYLQARQPVKLFLNRWPAYKQVKSSVYKRIHLTLNYDVITINMCTYQDHMSYQESEMIAKFEMAPVHSQLGR